MAHRDQHEIRAREYHERKKKEEDLPRQEEIQSRRDDSRYDGSRLHGMIHHYFGMGVP